MINQLTIFGVGLIGGSLALALKKAGYCRKVVGCSRNEAHLQKAVELGVIDKYCLDGGEAVEGADVVLLSVPLGAMKSILSMIDGHLSPEAIVTDAGSSKASVVEAAREVFGTVPSRFVPAHPIAGREKSGVTAAVEDLYVDHKVILTPLDNTSKSAVATVTAMWEAAGAQIKTLGVEQHDRVLAATSHLPHVLAYALVDSVSRTDYVEEIFQFAAGGFRDFTRIASSDPTMWRDICIENRAAILENLDHFQAELAKVRELVERSDARQIFNLFEHAKSVRDDAIMKRN
jgi:prephenate dehydrogenase